MVWKFNDTSNRKYNIDSHIISRFVDLREFLDTHTFETAEHLRKEVPLFSRSESEQIFKLLKEKKDVFTEWTEYLYEWQPAFLENNEMSPGLCITKALELGHEEIFELTLNAIDSSLPKIHIDLNKVDFLNEPSYGNVIAWLISSVFVSLCMLSNTTEEQFGQVFCISFSTAPLINLVLCDVKKKHNILRTTSELYGAEAALILTKEIKGLSSHIRNTPKCRTRRKLRV